MDGKYDFQYSYSRPKDVPCKKDCPDRTPGCHDGCEKYQEWRKKLDEIREIEGEKSKTKNEHLHQIVRERAKKYRRDHIWRRGG